MISRKTCKLPPFPDQGYYQVEDYSGTDTFSLYYSCNANYDLDGPNYPRCEGGAWLNKHPNCILVTGSPGVDEEDIRK
ncbi:hypothetical protein MSG28_014615 [Choristoneura fumiferana]|uniref:Uncharacterized protein n=1 Tax=Choristoneura fumiferana TaxID=7141 RepID=A0ACC0JSJ6_CHOFU|nr:hypothetical protein MSG28_014615 [Choristoneura fumiferana]